MPENKQIHNGLLRSSWREVIPICREILSGELQTIYDSRDRNFYSQILLNRILLFFAYWRRSSIFRSSKEPWQKNFHVKVLIPFLRRLSGEEVNDQRILNSEGRHPVTQESLLKPFGGHLALTDITVSDRAYLSILTELKKLVEYLGEESLKDLFESEVLGETFEAGFTRSRKKEKGIFYTPNYITDKMAYLAIEKLLTSHLVRSGIDPKEFLNPKLDNIDSVNLKTFRNLLENLTILDNAVGCGEYLLSALKVLVPLYEKVLHYNIKGKKEPGNREMRIKALNSSLINNLFGVDLDPGAVDTCKIRLWGIFIIESESHFEKWSLPELDLRIRVGNALIGFPMRFKENLSNIGKVALREIDNHEAYTSYLRRRDLEINDEDLKGLSVFHWQDEFPSVFHNTKENIPGFTLIIGNPPFKSTKRGYFLPIEKRLYKQLFHSASKQWDIYELFVERSINLLQPSGSGFLCYLLPKPCLTNENMFPLRELFLSELRIHMILDVGIPIQNAGVELIIIIASRSDDNTSSKVQIGLLDRNGKVTINHEVPQTVFESLPYKRITIGLTESEIGIIGKMKSRSVPLSQNVTLLARGIECGKKDTAINQKGQGFPLLRGEDVGRYRITPNNHYIHFQADQPSKYKKMEFYTSHKILLRRVASGLVAAEDKNERLFLNTLYGIKPRRNLSISFFLALLNSKLLNWWFNRVFLFDDTLFPYLRKSQLSELPIRVSIPKSMKNEGVDTVNTLFGRYEWVISVLANLVGILREQDEFILSGILEDELLDPLVFEFYFHEDLDSCLLAATETIFYENDNVKDSSILISEVKKFQEDQHTWAAIREQTSLIKESKLWKSSIGSERFRNTWKRICRNQMQETEM